MQEFAIVAALIVQVVLGIVWLVRLEGRINTHDALQRESSDRLERIEDKVDRLVERFGLRRG